VACFPAFPAETKEKPYKTSRSKFAQAIRLPTFIQKFLGSKINQDIKYIAIFICFPKFLQKNYGTMP
jgi:hypothetical protein